jgi:argininosuccinate lyase
MRDAAGGFALATDIAEYLVERGVAFRSAHEIVAAIVRDTVARGKSLEDLAFADFQRYSDVFERDVLELLDPLNSIKVRTVVGGPAPGVVRQRIKRLGG